MAHTGRLLDALKPPKRAAAYSGSGPGTDNPWSNYYQAYSTALDVERYDRALFEGKLVSSRWLERMLEPQAVAGPPDPTDRMAIPAAKSLHYAYDGWTTGVLFGQRVVFFAGSLGSFGGVNLHFPDEGVDIFVVSNDDTNQIGRIAQQVVKLTLDG
jgi:CubicO group peptidase (beta-lactamase class C family)